MGCATFLLWFGPTARLTVSDPELIWEIFVSKSASFEKYESHPLIRKLEGDGLLSLRGEKWAQHRKIITPSFHMENLKLLIPAMGKRVVEMIDGWPAMSDQGEVEIDVSEWFQSLTEDIITRTAFGSSYEGGKSVFRLQAQQMVFAAEAFGKVLIPGYRYKHLFQHQSRESLTYSINGLNPVKPLLYHISENTTSWKLDKAIQTSLVKLIGHRKETFAEEKASQKAKDLLGLMIDARAETSSKNKNPKFNSNHAPPMITIQDIVEECKTFFFAGKHSTSNLLTWTAVLLAMHPEWQEVAREEVLQVCGPHELPAKDSIAKLKKTTTTPSFVLFNNFRGHGWCPFLISNEPRAIRSSGKPCGCGDQGPPSLSYSGACASYAGIQNSELPYCHWGIPFPFSHVRHFNSSDCPADASVSLPTFCPCCVESLESRLSMIVNESLRLYPPVVATIRRAKADVELGSYKIPSGTELLIPILAVHHDPGTWGPDAAKFNPARFAEGAARASLHPMAFIPFGLGARACVGQNLALVHAKMTLAILLQRFSLRLSPSYQHAPTVLMLLYPQYGAPIIFQRL
ncbi:hypothetical protein ACLOJK_021322 [Asimina triloba]